MNRNQQQSPPSLSSGQATRAWEAVCAVYKELGGRGGAIDPDHALLLAQARTGLPLSPPPSARAYPA